MPLGDRTGPWGFGPMTGRGAGYCAGYAAPGYMNPGFGRGGGWGRGGGRGWGGGFGRGRGWGRGWGWGRAPLGVAPYAGVPAYGDVPYAPYAPSYSAEEELAGLKDQVKYFESALGDVKKRIEDLESGSEGE